MRRFLSLVGLTLGIQPLVACGSCPPPEVEVGDSVHVVIGATESFNFARCDALGFGEGAEFTGELTEHSTQVPFEGGPGSQACAYERFSGPMTIESDWAFERIETGGAGIWGGTFSAQLGEECTGHVSLSVDVNTLGGHRLWVRFDPEAGAFCPAECESVHEARIEVSSGGARSGSGGVTGAP